MTKLLLHACCGVCALEPVRLLKEADQDFSIMYENSNIHPKDEYKRRMQALDYYVCKPNEVELILGKYNVLEWQQKAGIYASNKQKRCRQCYKLRFEHLAKAASEKGFDAISTTLTISPYQYKEIIFEELESAAAKYNLEAIKKDYSPFYKRATEISRENGMYRQKYCGCHFSILEAEIQRAQLNILRKQKRKEKNANMRAN